MRKQICWLLALVMVLAVCGAGWALVFPVAPEAYQDKIEGRTLTAADWTVTTGSSFHQYGIPYKAKAIHKAVGCKTISDLFALDLNLNLGGSNNDLDNGLPVRPVDKGVVVWSDNNDLVGEDGKKITSGSGYVIVKHTGGLATTSELVNAYVSGVWYSGYMHMTNIQVKAGDEVSQDTTLGYISNVSPGSLTPHLHFAIYDRDMNSFSPLLVSNFFAIHGIKVAVGEGSHITKDTLTNRTTEISGYKYNPNDPNSPIAHDFSNYRNAPDVPLTAANFPDAKFRELLSQYDDGDGVLSAVEVTRVGVLRRYTSGEWVYELVIDGDDGNEINDLTGIKHLTALQQLCIFDNKNITTLDVSDCTALEYLACLRSELTALDVSGCTALRVLYHEDNNNLTKLDVSGTALKQLIYNDANLTVLGVSGCTALKQLQCVGNELTELDVSGCTALEELYCDDNNLTKLDVSDCTALRELSCGGNKLTELDVSGCMALRELVCDKINLTALDVGSCPNLMVLACRENELTTLDVSSCTTLRKLYCEDNNLTKLDVSGCTALKRLDCFNNNLTTLDVSGCTALDYLSCENNNLKTLDVRNCYREMQLLCDTGVTVLRNIFQKLWQAEYRKSIVSVLGHPSSEAQELSTDNATVGSDRKVSEVSAPSGQTAAAALPQVCVNASGVYVMGTTIDASIPTGSKLVWNPYPQTKARNILNFFTATAAFAAGNEAVFLDDDGNIIEGVPENHHVNVAAYLEEGVTYAPVIAVTDEIVKEGGDKPSGGDDKPSGGDDKPNTDDGKKDDPGKTDDSGKTNDSKKDEGAEKDSAEKEPTSEKGTSFTPGFDVTSSTAAKNAIAAAFGDAEIVTLSTENADIGEERTVSNLSAEQLAIVSSDTSAIAAILPEITPKKTAVFVLGAACGKTLEGALAWHSFPKDTVNGIALAASEGTCLFLDDNGEKITTVPANGHVNAAVLLTKDKTAAPVIAAVESNGSTAGGGGSGGGGCDAGLGAGALTLFALAVMMMKRKVR